MSYAADHECARWITGPHLASTKAALFTSRICIKDANRRERERKNEKRERCSLHGVCVYACQVFYARTHQVAARRYMNAFSNVGQGISHTHSRTNQQTAAAATACTCFLLKNRALNCCLCALLCISLLRALPHAWVTHNCFIFMGAELFRKTLESNIY